MPCRRILVNLLVLATILQTGCLQKKDISGRNYIPQETLVDVLVDLHLVDGITNDRQFFRKYEEVDSIDLLGPVLEKYQVTRQMFDTTMHAYSRYPELLDQVYNDVLMKLNIMMDENDQDSETTTPIE